MKKYIALLLAAVMIILSLTGCGGKTDDAKADAPPSSLPMADDNTDEVSLSKVELGLSPAKGYIDHTMVAEFSVKSEDGYECTGEDFIYLPKGSEIKSDKDLLIHTYAKMDGGVALNTNIMRAIGIKVNGYNGEFKAGTFTLNSACYVRISVKGKLSDITVSVPEGTETEVFMGDLTTIELAPKINALNEYFLNSGKSVNYLFITDLHNGSYVNDPDGDGKRNYDSLADTDARLETRSAKVAEMVSIANASPYVDFIVVGGDIINGYETTESNTYREAKKKNPKLTVSEHCVDQLQDMLAPLKDSKKPVFVLAGNHDDNSGHSLWQENHPEGPNRYPEYLVSDLAWYNEVFSEFVNVKVVQDSDYTHSGKKISKYYYYDLEKNGKITRIICLDYNDDRFPFDSKGVVTSDASQGGYSKGQLKWLAETALMGDFDECIMLSHAGAEGDLQAILTAYQEEDGLKKPALSLYIDYEDRKSGDILVYHHGHEHEDFNKFSYDTDYWTVSSANVSLEAMAVTKDSVYRYYVDKNTDNKKELTRSGAVK